MSSSKASEPREEIGADHHALADALPPWLRFGTSSWTFPGWGGICYPKGISTARLRREGLALYAAHPLLQTVGVDRSYYAPVAEKDWANYASQLPPDFPCMIKVWQGITTEFDLRARKPVDTYLHPGTFENLVLRPIERKFQNHCGSLLFQFPPFRHPRMPSSAQFCEDMDRFFGQLPKEFPYSVEVRNPELCSKELGQVLAAHGVSYTPTYWDKMPALRDQWAKLSAYVGSARGPTVVRLMLPPGESYETRRAAIAPFRSLSDRQPEMRQHLMEIIEFFAKNPAPLLVIVNNKAEGCSPLTIFELAEEVAQRLPKQQSEKLPLGGD